MKGLTGAHVLVLEDEPIIAFNLEDILLGLGCASIALATRIEDALEHLDKSVPDFAVLDVNIHGDRSYVVAEQLARRHVPFVFATGYGDLEHPQSYRSTPTVTKPYNIEQIREALEEAGIRLPGC